MECDSSGLSFPGGNNCDLVMKFSHDKNVKKLVSFIREIICCFCQDKSDIGILGRSIYLAKTI